VTSILVPFDFSPESKNALHYAAALARDVHASLALLHVVEPVVSQADFGYGCVTTRSSNQALVKHTHARLRLLAKRVANSGPPPPAFVRTGVAETEIVQAASDLAADLIVIGSRGCTAAPAPIGSTAEIVVRNAPCPVLVVRKKHSQSVRPRKRGIK
jgi:nucleotide-binding universal stress UspA family protein